MLLLQPSLTAPMSATATVAANDVYNDGAEDTTHQLRSRHRRHNSVDVSDTNDSALIDADGASRCIICCR